MNNWLYNNGWWILSTLILLIGLLTFWIIPKRIAKYMEQLKELGGEGK